MAKNKAKKSKKVKYTEPDSIFFLKIFLYFILGSLWLSIDTPGVQTGTINLPIGFVIGLFFSHHDHFQIDRKIEYVVLFLAMVLSYVAPIGFVLTI